MQERRSNWQTAAWSLWTLQRHGREVQCIVGLGANGFQTRFVYNGQLISEYMSDNWLEAARLASERRNELEAEGWMSDGRRTIQ